MRAIYFVALIVIPLAMAPTMMAVARPAAALPGSAPMHVETIHSGTICGWYSNPTPQNFSIETASSFWIIGTQGGFQAKGDWDGPDFRKGQWVHTNGGDYGYGCACLRGVLNETTKQVLRVYGVRARTLEMCRRNPALRAKEPFNPAAS